MHKIHAKLRPHFCLKIDRNPLNFDITLQNLKRRKELKNSFTLLVVIQQNLLTSNTRELATDKVADHLVLGLLDGVLVVLGSGSENTLLDEVDSWDGLAGGSCDG